MTEREIVEVMARAICSEVGACAWPDCKILGLSCQEQRGREARAALAALRATGLRIVSEEPSRTMIERGYAAFMEWDARTGGDYGISQMWDAMLLAASKENDND